MSARLIECQGRTSKTNSYDLFIDNSKSNGLLNFTNEISLEVALENDKVVILDGWEINCGGDKSWEKGDEIPFELDHPGLLGEIKTFLLKL